MKKTPVVSALALVLVGGLPVLADEPVLEPCKPVPGAAVLTPAGSSESFLGPLVPSTGKVFVTVTDEVSTGTARDVVVDLSGLPRGTTAVLQARLSWTLVPNDFDLDLRRAVTEASAVGRPGDRSESADLPVGHCSRVDVSVSNRAAVADEVTLDLGLLLA